MIDISSIEILKDCLSDENLVIGAGMSLTDVIKELRRWASKNEDFKYLMGFVKHLELVAHVPVRNVSEKQSFVNIKMDGEI